MPPLPKHCEAAFAFGTEYEVSTLNMLRKRLFLQSEPRGRTTIEWGKRVGGRLTKHAFAELPPLNLCDDAVQTALNEFRPLAFALAFKVQDALAEVVLEASGIAGARDLGFGEKRKKVVQCRRGGGLVEPEVLANHPKISAAWWYLYFDMEPFRSAIHHTGTLLRPTDGGLEIITSRPKRLGDRLVLSAEDQGRYARIACLVAEGVLDYGSFDPLRRRLIANDVAALERLHGVKGASEGVARLDSVKLVIAREYARSEDPFECEVDFDEVAAAAGTPLIDLEVVATLGVRTLSWRIPADSYPKGVHLLREGEPAFERWRVS